MKTFVSFQPCDSFGRYHYIAFWQTCVCHKDGNVFFSSVTKPTARQLRRWKKRAKQSHG